MPRPRKNTKMLRFAIPTELHDRFERLADVMGVDTPMAVRVLASIGLVQMETKLLPPDEAAVQGRQPADAPLALSPSDAAIIPSPELPDPSPFGFRPRSELDELDEVHELLVIGAPLVAPDRLGSDWSGYMKGL